MGPFNCLGGEEQKFNSVEVKAFNPESIVYIIYSNMRFFISNSRPKFVVGCNVDFIEQTAVRGVVIISGSKSVILSMR